MDRLRQQRFSPQHWFEYQRHLEVQREERQRVSKKTALNDRLSNMYSDKSQNRPSILPRMRLTAPAQPSLEAQEKESECRPRRLLTRKRKPDSKPYQVIPTLNLVCTMLSRSTE